MGANSQAWNNALNNFGSTMRTVYSDMDERERRQKEAEAKEAELQAQRDFLSGNYESTDDLLAAGQKHNQLGTASYNAMHSAISDKEKARAAAEAQRQKDEAARAFIEMTDKGVKDGTRDETEEEFKLRFQNNDPRSQSNSTQQVDNYRPPTQAELDEGLYKLVGFENLQKQRNEDRKHELEAADKQADNKRADAALKETERHNKAIEGLQKTRRDPDYQNEEWLAEAEKKLAAANLSIANLEGEKGGGETTNYTNEAAYQTLVARIKNLDEEILKEKKKQKKPKKTNKVDDVQVEWQ